MIKYSIIIPTFNRRDEVKIALDSALEYLKLSNFSSEVIVVDDCSTDGTIEFLISNYNHHINNGYVRLNKTDFNSGVVKARNLGISKAHGDWIILLDSDNELLLDSYSIIESSISNNENFPCYLFYCVDQNDHLIGEMNLPDYLDLNFLLNFKTQELFGVYHKKKFVSVFFNKEVEDLRRFELIGMLRIIKNYGSFKVVKMKARKYYTNSKNRLTSPEFLRIDSLLLSKGNFLILSEFFNELTIKSKFIYSVKILYYFIGYFVFRIKSQLKKI
jgi:glycosyltransferase involved in cell wall biosynthesis